MFPAFGAGGVSSYLDDFRFRSNDTGRKMDDQDFAEV
jgi:hypothetical protein